MVFKHYSGNILQPPFGTNNFSPRWSMQNSKTDNFGLSIRRAYSHETIMKPEEQNNSLWKHRQDKHSNLRFYPQQEYVVRNQDFSPREIRTVLPPISKALDESSQDKTILNEEELGKSLYKHSHRHIDLVKESLESRDQQNTGHLPLATVDDVLKRFRYPEENNLRQQVLNKYIIGESEWIKYIPLVNFLKQTRELHAVRQGNQFGVNNRVLPNVKRRSSSNDITSKPNHVIPKGVDYLSVSLDHFHGMGLRAAFADRRDGVLIAEMEKQYKKGSVDPNELLNYLNEKVSVLTSINGTVPAYKVKVLMQKLRFPFNNALLDKLIDRSNPTESGEMRCQEFMDFLSRVKIDAVRNPQTVRDELILSKMKSKDPFDTRKDSLDLSMASSSYNNYNQSFRSGESTRNDFHDKE